jgi:hypothetical protein
MIHNTNAGISHPARYALLHEAISSLSILQSYRLYDLLQFLHVQRLINDYIAPDVFVMMHNSSPRRHMRGRRESAFGEQHYDQPSKTCWK